MFVKTQSETLQTSLLCRVFIQFYFYKLTDGDMLFRMPKNTYTSHVTEKHGEFGHHCPSERGVHLTVASVRLERVDCT